MDTVFSDGTAAERPFAIDDGRASRPGRLRHEGRAPHAGCSRSRACRRPSSTGSPGSPTAATRTRRSAPRSRGPHIREIAKEADACFVLEGARENGDIVSARKGVADLRITYHGRAAHAGVEPERGRSAALQAAHATIALHG